MYPPQIHQEAAYQNALLTIRHFPLATLITPGDQPLVTHLPMIYSKDSNGHERLLAHMDKHNPQCAFLNGNGEAIFHGPNTYISPTVYSSKQLPTWNYIKVHLKGKMQTLPQNETKQSILDMTDFLEEKNSTQWKLEEDDVRMLKLLDFIVGFEFKIESWEGKYKLSQNKFEEDMMNAKQAMEKQTAPIYQDYLNQLYANHKNAQKN